MGGAADPIERRLLIRWTFGDWSGHRAVQGLSLLRTSISFAKILFPAAHFVLCHNHLISSRGEIEAIGRELDIPLFDSEGHLPEHLRSGNGVKNSWWKYAPPRLNPHGFELVLDNDVVLWKRPPALDEWLGSEGLLALGTRQVPARIGVRYGDYRDKVRQADPNLILSAGILGWPPGYTPPVNTALGLGDASDFFLTEEGFAALTFARYTGVRRLIPFDHVPIVDRSNIPPRALVEEFYGGHFILCTYGIRSYWYDSYQEAVTSYLRQRQKDEGGCR